MAELVGDERVSARQCVAGDVRHCVIDDRGDRMRSASWRRRVVRPHQTRLRRIGDVPGAKLSAAVAESCVQAMVGFVDDRMVRVLILEP